MSDVDDTIKQTGVTIGRSHVRNIPWILLDPIKPWRPVPQMPTFLQQLQRKFDAKFVYVSKGPPFTRNRLANALQRYGFPRGTIVLNPNFPFSLNDYKVDVISQWSKASPNIHLILIGDSAEHDPEDYGALARSFPNQIEHIYIRGITDDPKDRYEYAFRGIPGNRYEIFLSPHEIRK